MTNEIWLVSWNGEFPVELETAFGLKTPNEEWYRLHPWTLLIKNSHGWKDRWSHWQYREQAYGAALSWLEDQRVDGHEIEIGSRIDLDTIEVPFGAVEQYLKRLVETANVADSPEDLIAVQAQIKEARSMVGMLEHAQELVEARLVGVELPLIEDDSKYETYEYTPEQ